MMFKYIKKKNVHTNKYVHSNNNNFTYVNSTDIYITLYILWYDVVYNIHNTM